MTSRKNFTIGQLFTEADISRAMPIRDDIKKLEELIVRPIMERINRVTGQENDSRYMSYLLQFALNEIRNHGH